jgi:hypothetical protein
VTEQLEPLGTARDDFAAANVSTFASANRSLVAKTFQNLERNLARK